MEAETHIINSFLTVHEGLTKKSPSYPQLVTEFIWENEDVDLDKAWCLRDADNSDHDKLAFWR